MPLNLLGDEAAGDFGPSAACLLHFLCLEANVCRHDEVYGNLVQMEAATYAVDEGLVVTDEHGSRFRLRVTAEPLPPPAAG